MKELLERELNREITASESLELRRSEEPGLAERRRLWRSVSSALTREDEQGHDRTAVESRMARGVRQRLRIADTLDDSPRIALLPWAVVAVCALLLALGASWGEPEWSELQAAPGGRAAWAAHPPQTVPIGAGQGATAIAGMLYVYGDADNDGLNDYEEYLAGTDPTLSDTDGDGLTDFVEVSEGFEVQYEVTSITEGFIPVFNEDTQTTEDVWTETTETTIETETVFTDPNSKDSDGDLLEDADEILLGMNPTDPSDGNADTDGDDLTFAMEFYLGTDPDLADTDGDQLPDGWEVAHGFDPLNPDDGEEDENNDGTSNAHAYVTGGIDGVFGVGSEPPWVSGSPNGRDTDGDGISDREEIRRGSDPFDPRDPGRSNFGCN